MKKFSKTILNTLCLVALSATLQAGYISLDKAITLVNQQFGFGHQKAELIVNLCKHVNKFNMIDEELAKCLIASAQIQPVPTTTATVNNSDLQTNNNNANPLGLEETNAEEQKQILAQIQRQREEEELTKIALLSLGFDDLNLLDQKKIALEIQEKNGKEDTEKGEKLSLEKIDCEICYNDDVEGMICKECTQAICKECATRVERGNYYNLGARCPFCRAENFGLTNNNNNL